MITEREVAEKVRRLDPIGAEVPPAVGSERRANIVASATGSSAGADAPARWLRRWSFGARAAAVVVVAAVGVALTVALLADEPSAASTLRRAVEAHEGARSYEAVLVTRVPGDGTTTFRTAVDGDDHEIDIDFEPLDGPVEHSTVVLLGDLTYRAVDGVRTVEPRGDETGIQPSYSTLSAALIEALRDADVARTGEEDIAGERALRYEVELSARSVDAFADPELGLGADELSRLVVWIADDQLLRVELEYTDGTQFVGTYSNVDGVVTVTAPPTGG